MSERQLRNQQVIDELRTADGAVGGDFTGVPLRPTARSVSGCGRDSRNARPASPDSRTAPDAVSP
ncbi:hypothetical protein [Streptomyces sp. NPDC052107]|uniref:hypothetical protein n=1 Tax=Streptomyces sp. NPDC052107 TaxID=3155632 RepID=UPI003422DBBB